MNIENLMNDEVFAAQIEKAASAEEIVALFADKGVEVSLEIAQELFAPMEGELDEMDLEGVAGGGIIGRFLGGVSRSLHVVVSPKVAIGYAMWRVQGCTPRQAYSMAVDVKNNGG